MKTVETNWKGFRDIVYDHLRENRGSRLCRGQSNATWNLRTSFHRANLRGASIIDYFKNLIPFVADAIGTLEGREINTENALVNGAFLAYAQHHGLPTPLLDWSFSPYKAAYYAFSEVNDLTPAHSHTAIYIFDSLRWNKEVPQFLDYTVAHPHVSLLQPKLMGNRRQMQQQGSFLFTNIDDVEAHIISVENERKTEYLTKFLFESSEKPLVMTELETMGINAYSLFGGTEGMFRYFKESYFRTDKVGEPQNERFKQLLEILLTNSQTEEKILSPSEETRTNLTINTKKTAEQKSQLEDLKIIK